MNDLTSYTNWFSTITGQLPILHVAATQRIERASGFQPEHNYLYIENRDK